jgi:hypothetical protein
MIVYQHDGWRIVRNGQHVFIRHTNSQCLEGVHHNETHCRRCEEKIPKEVHRLRKAYRTAAKVTI